jgi:DNA-binding transcriptional LysR family regulator
MIDQRLKTFVVLCRLMNYRRTAEALNMTQPAVTQHIQYLEKQYGCRLFLYDRRKLIMTPEGEVLLKYAQNVLYQEKKLREQLAEQRGWDLSIGATKTIGEFVISEHVEAWLAVAGNRLSVEVDNTEHLLGKLSDGSLDFALIEGTFDRQMFASQLYREELFLGICGKEHPFAGQIVPLDSLWKEHLILREEGSGTRNILEQVLAEHNRSVKDFRMVTTISNFGLMMRLVRDTGGITFAYQAVLDQNDGLTAFAVKGWEILREFNYVFLDTPVSRQAVKLFEEVRPTAGPSVDTYHLR